MFASAPGLLARTALTASTGRLARLARRVRLDRRAPAVTMPRRGPRLVTPIQFRPRNMEQRRSPARRWKMQASGTPSLWTLSTAPRSRPKLSGTPSCIRRPAGSTKTCTPSWWPPGRAQSGGTRAASVLTRPRAQPGRSAPSTRAPRPMSWWTKPPEAAATATSQRSPRE